MAQFGGELRFADGGGPRICARVERMRNSSRHPTSSARAVLHAATVCAHALIRGPLVGGVIHHLIYTKTLYEKLLIRIKKN